MKQNKPGLVGKLPRFFSATTVKITLICATMSGPLTFTEFYTNIRSHFTNNLWEYEKFKNHCKGDPEKNISGNRAKVEYLMGHAFVQKSLATLGSTIHKICLLMFTSEIPVLKIV